MKFEINLKDKKIVLIEDASFEEIDQLKSWIGDIDGWTVSIPPRYNQQLLNEHYSELYNVPDVIWPYQRRWEIYCEPRPAQLNSFLIKTNKAVLPTGFTINKLIK